MNINEYTILSNKQQSQLQLLKYRATPYTIIIMFSLFASLLRYYLLPDWSLYIHLLMLFTQIVILTCIWHIVKWLNALLDKRIPFYKGAITRVVLQISLSLLLIAPIFIALFFLTHKHFPAFINKEFLGIVIALFTIVIFLFNFAFYAFHFFGNWQKSVEDKAALEVQAADLEREKSTLQYHQLRNQVNPHYLFNTLTSLDGLIHTNPDLASEFVRHMAKVYRYVLRHTENEVVNLNEELEFIQHYIQLLQIRYAGGINIDMKISAAAKDKGIVMVTLQMLIDNAIKHNIVQENEPLHITIKDEDNYIVIYNNKQLRKQIESSNGQGLIQLKELYSYLTDKPVVIEETADMYTIKLPLL